MLILTQEVHDEMTAVWATSGVALMTAVSGEEVQAYSSDFSIADDRYVRVLKFVAEQRLAARKPRRRVRTKTAAKP